MARFMDFHDDLKLPAAAIAQIAGDTRDARTGQLGVRQIDLYHNAAGTVCCLLEGPDEEAIRQHHVAMTACEFLITMAPLPGTSDRSGITGARELTAASAARCNGRQQKTSRKCEDD